MAIVIKFKHLGFTEAKYQQTIQKLEEAGLGNPKGRSFHVSYGDKNEVEIFDIWESIEDFEAFGKTLIPILSAMGIQLGKPDIQNIFGVIKG